MKSNSELANEVREAARRRQEDDEVEEIEREIVDTVYKGRGAGAGYGLSLKDIAIKLGFGDVKNPAKKGQTLVSSAMSSFAIGAYVVAIVEACEKRGIARDEAQEIAIRSYERELMNGRTRKEILGGVF